MRAGGAWHRVKFFAKDTDRDAYGSSVDTWDFNNPAITTRGEVRYTGGTKTLSNEEKFYAKSVELFVRFRKDIVETMKIQLDETNDIWLITYIEMLGVNETLRLTIEKCADGLTGIIVEPPTSLTATDGGRVLPSLPVFVDLAWVNNAADDGVVIERSEDGNSFDEVVRIAKAVSPSLPVDVYKDTMVVEETRYFYRAKAFNYYNYSVYTSVEVVTTGTVI